MNKALKDWFIALLMGCICFIGVFLCMSVLDKNKDVSNSSSNKISKNDEMRILKLLPSMSSINKDAVEAMLGEPKEIYKDKIYTYVDKHAQYDLLIEDKLESAVVTIKNKISIVSLAEVLKLIIPDYSDSLIKDYNVEKLNGEVIVKIYGLDNYSKLEIIADGENNQIKNIKVKY